MVKTTQRKTMKQSRRSHSISSVITKTAVSARAMLRRSSWPVGWIGGDLSILIYTQYGSYGTLPSIILTVPES